MITATCPKCKKELLPFLNGWFFFGIGGMYTRYRCPSCGYLYKKWYE